MPLQIHSELSDKVVASSTQAKEPSLIHPVLLDEPGPSGITSKSSEISQRSFFYIVAKRFCQTSTAGYAKHKNRINMSASIITQEEIDKKDCSHLEKSCKTNIKRKNNTIARVNLQIAVTNLYRVLIFQIMMTIYLIFLSNAPTPTDLDQRL